MNLSTFVLNIAQPIEEPVSSCGIFNQQPYMIKVLKLSLGLSWAELAWLSEMGHDRVGPSRILEP